MKNLQARAHTHKTSTQTEIIIFQLYFHGAMEVPDISRQRYTFYESDYTTVELVALEIITNEDVKKYVRINTAAACTYMAYMFVCLTTLSRHRVKLSKC